MELYFATHDAVGTPIESLSTDEIKRRLSILRSTGAEGVSGMYKRGYEKVLRDREESA